MPLTKVTYSMIQGATLNVLDFGADPTGTNDSTTAIQSALNNANGKTVFLPTGAYKITDTLSVSKSNFIGEGVFYSSPYETSSISGAVIKPVGMANKAAVSITTITNDNKVSVGSFGVDMSLMNAGSLSGDFDVIGMTKAIYIENRHDVALYDIEVFAVPANSAAFVFNSVQPGGGLYWGKHTRLASRTKLTIGNDHTAKGFVLLGTEDDITAQIFTDCVSYRGWYLKNVNACQFIGCHAENNPKDGVYIDGGSNLSFVGGFFEGQGSESTTRTYYPIYGVNTPTKCSFIGLNVSGNGIYGFSGDDGLAILNCGVYGQSYDYAVQQVGNMTVDGAGNVNANQNSGALIYAVDFNSDVPPTTVQQLFFSSTPDGFDQANEWNNTSGNYTFKVPNAALGGGTGVYLISVQLQLAATSGVAIPSGTIIKFGLGGSVNGSTQLKGPQYIAIAGNGTTNLYLNGSMLVRLDQGVNQYMTFFLYHNNAVNIKIVNNNGDISESFVCVSKIN